MNQRPPNPWIVHDLSNRAWVFVRKHHRFALDPADCTDRRVRVLLEGIPRGPVLIDEVRSREIDPIMVAVPTCFRPIVASFLTQMRRGRARRTDASMCTAESHSFHVESDCVFDAERVSGGFEFESDDEIERAGFHIIEFNDGGSLDGDDDAFDDELARLALGEDLECDPFDTGVDLSALDDGDECSDDERAVFEEPIDRVFDSEPEYGIEGKKLVPVDVALGTRRPRRSSVRRGASR